MPCSCNSSFLILLVITEITSRDCQLTDKPASHNAKHLHGGLGDALPTLCTIILRSSKTLDVSIFNLREVALSMSIMHMQIDSSSFFVLTRLKPQN